MAKTRVWKDHLSGKDKFQKGVGGGMKGGKKKGFVQQGNWLVQACGSDKDKDGSVGYPLVECGNPGVKGDIKYCYSRKNKFWNIGDQWNTGLDTKKILDGICCKESLANSVRPKPNGKVKPVLSKSRDHDEESSCLGRGKLPGSKGWRTGPEQGSCEQVGIQDFSGKPYKYKFPELEAYYSADKCCQEFYPGTLTVKISTKDPWEQASLRIHSKFVNKDRRLAPVSLNASFDEAYDRNQNNPGSFDAIGRPSMNTVFPKPRPKNCSSRESPRSINTHAGRLWTEQ